GARQAHNLKAEGSNPAPATKYQKLPQQTLREFFVSGLMKLGREGETRPLITKPIPQFTSMNKAIFAIAIDQKTVMMRHHSTSDKKCRDR
ncbi:MAG: hypothetical protein JSR13_21205, partial [Proteobacteria bacterium]|nr:hypothetical protein [Pseudomonadota bacterium]